jgi:hypothetical protein
MNKIVELVIDFENMPLEDLGVSIMSLVDMPAIGVNWMAFAQEQFVTPSPGEPKDEFISRCIPVLRGEGYPEDQAAAICYSTWEQGFGIDTSDLPPYVQEVDEEFQSYTDYPQAARENAQRALDWAEENGWGDCGTGVGKARANQLAKGEAITRDTVARMAAFERHRQNSGTPYGEGCGKLMWDAWGGDEGIRWAQRKLEEIDNEKLGRAILSEAQKLGEEYNPGETLYLELNREEFMTVAEVLEGIQALDILSRSDIRRDAPAEIKYRYAGPRGQRFFCRGMLALNKLYTRAEINQITTATAALNPGMGHNSPTYSVWNYKGGVNCKHYWQELAVFRNTSGQLILVDRGPAPGDAGETAGPENNYWRFSADDQMIITGPAMIPNQLIPRKGKDGSSFAVFFSEETVRKIAGEFLARHAHNNTDINHNDQVTNENTLLESWIVEDPDHDKATALGYKGLPKGTWMVSYKINNPETWAKIKSGELNGFSVTGDFIQKIVA